MRKVLSKSADKLLCLYLIHINNTIVFAIDIKIWKILP